MKKAKIIFSVIAFTGISVIFNLDLLAAGDIAPVIKFQAAGASVQKPLHDFPTVYRGEVTFAHEKHSQSLQGDCGKCHHDGDGEPLADVDAVNEAGGCADCHSEESLLRGKALDSVSPEEALEHTPNAMHRLCVGCHRKSNNETNALSAPEACRACHKNVGEK